MNKNMKVGLFIIFFKFNLCTGVIFDGGCPDIKGIQDFQCSNQLKNNSFRILAHLPVDATTLNIFYSPYASLDCLMYQITCSYMSNSMVSVKILCNAIREGELLNYYFNRGVQTCLPTMVNFGTSLGSTNQIQTFGLSLQIQCPEKLADYKISMIISDEKGLVILYGCREIENGARHDEGMWLLYPVVENSEWTSYDSSLINAGLQMVEGTSATLNDFMIAGNEPVSECACASCDYMYSCPEDVVVEDSTVDDYYVFTKPVRRSKPVETVDYYSNTYNDAYSDYQYPAYQYPDYNYPDYNGSENVTESVTQSGVVTESSVKEESIENKSNEAIVVTESSVVEFSEEITNGTDGNAH